MNIPDNLDLTELRFEGPSEELLPAEVEIPTSGRKGDKAPINQELVQQV